MRHNSTLTSRIQLEGRMVYRCTPSTDGVGTIMLQFHCSCKEEQKRRNHSSKHSLLFIMDAVQRDAQCAQHFLGGTGKLYKPSLDHLMLLIVGRSFALKYIYSDDEFNAITPAHVLHRMNFMTFGTINPAVNANPISARSNSLQYWKKAILFFHPNRLMVSRAGCNEGNPTHSVEINNLIKRVKKKRCKETGCSMHLSLKGQLQNWNFVHYIQSFAM